MDIAELRVKEKIDTDLAISQLGKHLHIFDNDEKWFIPSFIEFQYGALNESVNAHRSVLNKLKQYSLTKKYEQFINSSLTDQDKDKDKDKDMDKDKDKIKYKDNVRLFKKEYDKLIEKYGLKATEWMIDKLGNYKGSKGKTYKSDYRAILNWVADEAKKKKIVKEKILEY